MIKSDQNNGERGVILIVVLWTMAILSLLITSFNLSARSGMILLSSEVSAARQKALLDAGIELAASRLMTSVTVNRWRADGKWHEVNFAGALLRIRVFDPNGRIDLNKADGKLLEGLFRQFVETERDALKLRDLVMDWRDDDHKTAPSGAEDIEYQRARKLHGAGDAEFMDITQLQHILGMTPLLFRKLRPFVTVHNHDGRINPASASREVLQSVPGLNERDVEQFIAEREANPDVLEAVKRLASKAQKWLSPKAGPAFDIVVEAPLNRGGKGPSVRATIIPGANGSVPYHLLLWQQM